MTDTITLTGLVATEPRHIVTSEGLAITSFRLASTQRRFDRAHARWVDGETNWYTITVFRQMAINVTSSMKKGERVIVTGKIKVRAWDNGERSGITIDVEAEAIGHDLAWGTTVFTRNIAVATLAQNEITDSTSARAGESVQNMQSQLQPSEPTSVPF